MTGIVLAATDGVLLMDCDGFPCAFAYDQVLPDDAYRAKWAVVTWQRGGVEHLRAEDWVDLGRFALHHGRIERARRAFAAAARSNPKYRHLGKRAIDEFREQRRAFDLVEDPEQASEADPNESPDQTNATLPRLEADNVSANNDASRRQRIIEGYKNVGREIEARLGGGMTLLETPHFLIWTDWASAEHDLLRGWCEQMYESLADRFSVPPDAHVFAGKCPIFCMRSRTRFTELAELLDGYDATGAVGYTSRDANGHVHVVVCRQGGSPAARDAFASTLIHEGTHAFMHRYRPGDRLPPWINEGFANVVAQAVLGERCPNAEAAEAVRREIIRRNCTIEPAFSDDDNLDARYYPVAHGLVAFLIGRDAGAFVRLIDDLKAGASAETALMQHYALTRAELEQSWRRATR